jgi:cytochrome c biogenesis protein CcdA
MPGETIWMALALEIAPGWNTYWHNPGATGLPPTVTWDTGEQAPDLLFPTPMTKPFGDDASLLTYGYVDRVVHPFQWQIPADATGEWSLQGEARWLVCREICIPESQRIEVRLPVVTDARDVHRAQDAQLINAARAQVPTAFPAQLTIVAPNQFWIAGLRDVRVLDVMPNATGEVAGLVKDQRMLPDGLLVTMDRPLDAAELVSEDWTIRTEQGGIQVRFDATLPIPDIPGQSLSLLLVLLMALAGGLLLNLMPCVFPVLSIKALSIAQKAAKARRDVQLGAWLYTAGILVTMLLLASVMVALQAGGAQIGWGFQLQTPWFVALLVYIFVLLGLWLYGWIEFGSAMAGLGQSWTEGGQGRAEFFTGVLAVIVATPCTAPFMGVAMGYTLTQPWWITMLVFAALGLGLALPMLVFAVTPELAARLPRPGDWMVRLKQFLAFPILATAVWLLWVLVRQTSADVLLLILGGLLVMIFGLWLSQGRNRLSQAAGWVIAVAALFAIPQTSALAPAQPQASQIDVQSEAYTSSALRGHLEAGRSVFINMTADWCITCKVTEQRLLNTALVDQLFTDLGVIRMTGDWTRYDPSITTYLNDFDRVGVPLYVVHHPGKDPIVLSQFPSFAELERAAKAGSSL